jgi:hypothetical protein
VWSDQPWPPFRCARADSDLHEDVVHLSPVQTPKYTAPNLPLRRESNTLLRRTVSPATSTSRADWSVLELDLNLSEGAGGCHPPRPGVDDLTGRGETRTRCGCGLRRFIRSADPRARGEKSTPIRPGVHTTQAQAPPHYPRVPARGKRLASHAFFFCAHFLIQSTPRAALLPHAKHLPPCSKLAILPNPGPPSAQAPPSPPSSSYIYKRTCHPPRKDSAREPARDKSRAIGPTENTATNSETQQGRRS